MVKLYYTSKNQLRRFIFHNNLILEHIPIQLSTNVLKSSNFYLKTYNLQNTAIKVIIIENLLHLRSSRTEVSLRLTVSRICCGLFYFNRGLFSAQNVCYCSYFSKMLLNNTNLVDKGPFSQNDHQHMQKNLPFVFRSVQISVYTIA